MRFAGSAVEDFMGSGPRMGEIAASASVGDAKENLAGYKCPQSVDYVTALPVGGTGKVLKKELRAPYWDGHLRKV